MKRDFKGIWIPKDVWLSEDLTLQEKVFFVEINSLDNEDGCFANNEYFANFFKVSKVRVSEVINSLVKKGYLASLISKEEGNKRILKTLLKDSLIPSSNKVCNPLKGSFNDNNTVNNTYNKTNRENTLPFVNNDFERRKNLFKAEIDSVANVAGPAVFSKKMVDKFFSYYTQLSNVKPGKMEFEAKLAWSTKHQLYSWRDRELNNNPSNLTSTSPPYIIGEKHNAAQ